MRLVPWDEDAIRRLREGDDRAWQVFAHQALGIIRERLRGHVREADLEDECMKALARVYQDLKTWDPGRGLSLESFVRQKANDGWKRYCEKQSHALETCSVETLIEGGDDPASDERDPYGKVENWARAVAIGSALSKLETLEYVFVHRLGQGDSLALAAAVAGYSESDPPANVVRRVKRKLGRLLASERYFVENPEELTGLN